MAPECTTESCDVESRECSSGGCSCGNAGCSGDPLDCAVGLWTCSSFQALKEVQVELLKSRIHKAFGAKLEKAADAAVEALQGQWQSMLAQSKAKTDFRDRLRGLWQEGSK